MIKKITVRIINSVKVRARAFLNGNRLRRSKKKLIKFHNIHEGKRCFIIGNGPSLVTRDLEKIQSEITFASHRIYDIFPMTTWRPTYYCAQDQKLIFESSQKIDEIEVNDKFIASLRYGKVIKGIKKAKYVNLINEKFYPELPKFSDDVTVGTYEGFTVTYMCIQLAVYMGFTEIYLLGVDHNYSVTMLPNGEILKNEDIKDYFGEGGKFVNIPQLYKSTLAYVSAEKYATEHGIKIYNATRGGKLDAFERVNFDNLFK